MSETVELLFFDTFAHDNTEELNLDLVQFPKPVYVTEVRIIPLGARVQADFPGGVRLGATNPSQFKIEFFVNDLGKPGASTFESLGGFEYNQNGCINLNCVQEETVRRIPTDGLVLRGWYTTITLAVYGTLTNNITEQIVQPVANPTQPNTIADAQQITTGAATIKSEWNQESASVLPVEYAQNSGSYQQPYSQTEPYSSEYGEYYNEVPKDPRSYHHPPEGDWDAAKTRPVSSSSARPSESSERDRERGERRDRDEERKSYQRSHSRDRSYQREERDWDHWERSRDRDRSYKQHEESSYRRNYERDERKRPRTPPIQSPKRPHTPKKESSPVDVPEPAEKEQTTQQELTVSVPPQKSPVKTETETTPPVPTVTPVEEPAQMDVEEFEPILSDEEIVDEEMDYDYSAYTNNDDLIKQFIPGVTNLRKFEEVALFTISKECLEVEERLKFTIGLVDDHFKSSIEKYTVDGFDKHKTEMKEEFIHVCEKLIPLFDSTENFTEIMRIHAGLSDKSFTSAEDEELAQQIRTITETVVEWLKIAINYDLANIQEQPVYKIRHIKCGVRLAEWCCNSGEFVKLLWSSQFNLHQALLDLYDQEHMALSIKLMIIKALDTYLLHKFAIEKFLGGGGSEENKENGFHRIDKETNGYKILVEKLRKDPLVRIKFALNSILKKLNVYEIFYKIHETLLTFRNAPEDLKERDVEFIARGLDQIANGFQNGQFVFSQPKRFLPVLAQFEIVRNNNTKNILVEFFRMFDGLQCFFLLLSLPATRNLPAVKTPIFEILSELLKTPEGVEYLAENHETVNGLVRCLLRTDEEIIIQDYIEVKSHNLGLEAAYKLEALYCVKNLIRLGEKNYDFDALEVIDQLHSFFCLTFTHVGRISVVQILTMKENIFSLMQFMQDLIHIKDKSESFIAKLKKSPGIAYIVDLLAFTVVTVPNIPFVEANLKQFCHIIDQHDLFEESVSARLLEMKQYLIPFENTTLNYDNISLFVERVAKQIDNATSLPGQLITSLRIIHHLGVSPHVVASPLVSEKPLSHYVELKYKHVILQLFSLDGMTILTKILQKMNDFFEQPNLHTPLFASSQGFTVINMLGPCVELLKQMLTYVIQCRNTHFKDLTTVPVLLHTYNLFNSYPTTCSSYLHAQQVCKNIIETLLVYTQPLSDEIHEKDSLNKTLWSLMCGEVIKFVTYAPCTFISGLLVLSELLPLPFPIQTGTELNAEEVAWAVNLRKLWSAHLHPHTSSIQEMIARLCSTSHPQLLNLLRRVCVQLADLAANTALMIARGITEILYKALQPVPETKLQACSNILARQLNFFACLVTHSTVKCAVLSLITVKDEKQALVASLFQVFQLVLKVNSASTSHVQAQECILSIIQSFCDTEITLLQNSHESDVYLANSLPLKDNLLIFIGAVLDYLQVENSFLTYLPAVRTLLLLTEHDYGFFHLREQLLNKRYCNVFGVILGKLAKSFSKENAECLSTLNTLVEFLRVCAGVEEEEECNTALMYTPRKIKLSIREIRQVVGWKPEKREITEGEQEEEEEEEVAGSKHTLLVLEEILRKLTDEEISFEALLEGVSALVKLLKTEQTGEETESVVVVEPVLPEPETLLVQFAGRLIFTTSAVCDERLTIRYWLSIPGVEFESENVSCDLTEVTRQYLPQEFSIVREIEKLCRICPIENNNEKEKRESDQKTKMKKPFITPVRSRGFPRTIQQRSDLFRSRPPNTSRPPSLHVDDFVALETCGAQPTGPTGYNKFSRELLASTRIARGSRGRSFVASERSVQCRQMSWWGPSVVRGPYQ